MCIKTTRASRRYDKPAGHSTVRYPKPRQTGRKSIERNIISVRAGRRIASIGILRGNVQETRTFSEYGRWCRSCSSGQGDKQKGGHFLLSSSTDNRCLLSVRLSVSANIHPQQPSLTSNFAAANRRFLRLFSLWGDCLRYQKQVRWLVVAVW